VIVSNTGPGELFHEELAEIREELQGIPPRAAEGLRAHLADTKRIFAIEVDQPNLSEEAWEMVDALERFLAARCDGIMYAPDDGFFDPSLERIASVL
jgi:hypothetical protein